DRYRNDMEATVTPPDFLNELYKVTPDKYHQLIDEWFKKIITYDLSIANASIVKQIDGSFEVTVVIEAEKIESVDGIEKKIPMTEPISIGLFTDHPSRATK